MKCKWCGGATTTKKKCLNLADDRYLIVMLFCTKCHYQVGKGAYELKKGR